MLEQPLQFHQIAGLLIDLSPSYGTVDLVFGAAGALGSSSAARLAIVASSFQKSEDDTDVFPEIHIVVLKRDVDLKIEMFQKELDDYINNLELKTNAGESVDPQVLNTKQRTHFHVIASSESHKLIGLINSIRSRSALFVFDAESYGSIPSQVNPISEDGGVKSSKYVWMQNIINNLPLLQKAAAEKEVYVLLICNPILNNMMTEFSSIRENSNLIIIREPIEYIVRKNFEHWENLISENKIEQLLREIDKIETSLIDRSLIRGYALSKADRTTDAFAEIQPYFNEYIKLADAYSLIIAIDISLKAGHLEFASTLLQALAKCELNDGELFSAVRFTQRMKINPIQFGFSIPNHEKLLDRFSTMLPENFDGALITLASDALSRGQVAVASSLVLRYHRSSQLTMRPFASLLTELIEALFLLDPIDPKKSEEGSNENKKRVNDETELEESNANNLELTWHQKQNALTSKEIDERTSIIMELAFIYLGMHPDDTQLRNRISRLLSPQVVGMHGMVLLVHRILHGGGGYILKSTPNVIYDEVPLDEGETQKIITDLLNQIQPLREQSGYVLGIGEISLEGVKCSARYLLGTVTNFLEFCAGNRISTDEDVAFLMRLLHLSILLAKKAGEDVLDLRLLTVAGGGLATAGRFQMARNLAEQGNAMLGSGPSLRRRRVAWFQFADLSHKAGDIIDALLGLACAASIKGAELSPEEALSEVLLWIRILRDVGLSKLAMTFFPVATELLQYHGSREHYQPRLVLLEASVKMCNISSNSTHEEIYDIIIQLLNASQMARSLNDELFPIAVSLTQMEKILAGRLITQESTDLHRRILDELTLSTSLMGEPNASRIRMLGSVGPTVAEIQDYSRTVAETIYSEDIGRDVKRLVVMARKAIAKLQNDEETLFLLETMTEHAIRLPGETDLDEGSANEALAKLFSQEHQKITELELVEAAKRNQELQQKLMHSAAIRSARLSQDPRILSQFVEKLSQKDITVHVFGVDEDRSLVRVTAKGGAIASRRESREIFDFDAFLQWKRTYPFGYHNFRHDDPHGYFRIEGTLSGLGISAEACTGATILVPEQQFQMIPAGLFLANKEPLGYEVPASSTPSVAWLAASQATPRALSGLRRAWIPVEENYSDFSTLRALRDAVSPTLVEHGFSVGDSAELPEDMSNSDVAVLGAHGRLGVDQRFFRHLANEGAFRVTAFEVARRLRHSGIVVLFVCSGGRLDAHPFATATVGLPRTLLHYGCRAVVASAWPLDVSVPSRWIPRFLRELDSGQPVIQAVFYANQEVRSYINHPVAFLAMNVYGDPLFRLTSVATIS